MIYSVRPRALHRLTWAIAWLAAGCVWSNDSAGDDALTYEREVRPLLRTHCFQCHGEGQKQEGGLDLRLRRFLIQGGDSGPAMDAGPGGDDSGPGPVDSGPAGTDAGLEYDKRGCLTFMGASRLCGFSSDDTICAFSVECGTSSDMGQCGINCEMGTTVMCYTTEHVACLQNPAADLDCAALESCGWIL